MSKSPFLIDRHMLPIKLCEELVENVYSNIDKTFSDIVNNDNINSLIENNITQKIQKHFSVKIVNTSVSIESHTTRAVPTHMCDSSVFSNGMWYRNKDIDFVTVIFLKNDITGSDEPIDDSFEVYGGKLEFPTFNFGFSPERGTAITYPAVPNFLNTISKVKIGRLDVLRIYHRSDTMFVYQPTEYAGNPAAWFVDL